MATGRTYLNTKKLMCEPTRRHGIFVHPPTETKAKCFIQDYYKGYGSNTHERQYVLEYENYSNDEQIEQNQK